MKIRGTLLWVFRVFLGVLQGVGFWFLRVMVFDCNHVTAFCQLYDF